MARRLVGVVGALSGHSRSRWLEGLVASSSVSRRRWCVVVVGE